jgi:hypothetical protein
MEAIYDDIAPRIGFMSFAPVVRARGAMFGAAARAESGRSSDAVVSEAELYGDSGSQDAA